MADDFEDYEGADWLTEDEAEADIDWGIYEFGDFEVGDRVIINGQASETKHVGAIGTVVRVDYDVPDQVYPISVWLDVFGKATKPEIEGGLGLAVCARELSIVKERTIK
jgi:hypothetical protein